MLKKFSIAGLILLGFIGTYVYGPALPYFYFLLSTIILICILYFLSKKSYALVFVLGTFYLSAAFTGWFQIDHDLFLLQNFFCALVIGVWIFLLRDWESVLASIESQKQKVSQDIALLREKHNARLDSLGHLERQVASLLDLFEAAKDFNECLYFDQLMDILDKRVKEQISFRALTLLVFSNQSKAGELVSKAMSVGRQNQEDKNVRTASDFEIGCACAVKEHGKVLRFNRSEEIARLNLSLESVFFPVWIFPLQVEEKMIATVIIEGADLEDFPKFELLAAQLALQVKKISLYETVKELSIIDGLTKVYVRRHFLERLEEELKRALKRKSPLSVLMLDIDHFKSYNDQFGHLVGDSTLREVASVIRENVRKVDLVARYGGEEFVIALPEIGSPANFETAERIRSAVARKHFRLYDEETKATVSVGISSFPKDLTHQDVTDFNESLMLELIQKADKALYRAKEEGRNRVVSYGQFKS